MSDRYAEFLKGKRVETRFRGIEPREPHPILFDFQRDLVKWALRRGRACLFEDCGLGKTFQQIEWARQIPGNVLILAPLAVANQTISEAKKLGCEVRYCRHQTEVKKGITIANYEMLEHFEPKKFKGIVLDECFPGNAQVEIFENGCILKRCIQDLRRGDKILNASGRDSVTEIYRRRVERAVKVSIGEDSITSSENHPFYTQRGWVSAIDLTQGDYLMETSEAMRLVSDGVCSEVPGILGQTLLRDILLSEMEDASKLRLSESAFASRCYSTWIKQGALACIFESESEKGNRPDSQSQSHEQSGNAAQSEPEIASDRAQTFRAWWKRNRTHQTAVEPIGDAARGVESRVRLIVGEIGSRLSNLLQARLGESRKETLHRGGWAIPLQPEATGSKAGYEIGFVRVDGIEILERGHPELDQWRNAEGIVYFYDLKAKRHPSFSVNGFLVHNSSIIKHFEGKFRNAIITGFRETPFRLACTATPAPNDHMELGNHAEFVGAMSRTEMLSMFFVHDGGDTSKWRLKGHAEEEFWRWVCSWAVMIRKPSDLGYDDNRFILPRLTVEQISIEHQYIGNNLFAVEAETLAERISARRESIGDRVKACAELVNASREAWLIWCNLNTESEELVAALDGAVQIQGSETMEAKIQKISDFIARKTRVLITKPSIAGHGLNLQHCCNVAFVGLSDSWEQYYQAVRRCWRFGQTREVRVHIITSTAEGQVVANIKRKEADATRMAKEMVKHMHSINEASVKGTEITSDAYVEDEAKGQHFTMHLGDAVDVAKGIPSESIGFSIFSPPFASLYTYSASDRDMGNSKTYEEFSRHFEFLSDELFRVTQSGRLLSCHCMNLPTSKSHHGYIGLKDFRGDLIRCFQKSGFIFHSEVCIWKDPVTAMQRTKALGLLHKQMVKDSCMSRQGVPDYLVTMRKPGVNLNPVEGELDRWIGEGRGPSGGRLSIDLWQQYASPVWMDINPSRTLQKDSARDEKDERHICPLQLDVIERAMELWSNPGDTILSPFAGIGSEGFVAVSSGREFIGIELKASYWKQAVANLELAEAERDHDLL